MIYFKNLSILEGYIFRHLMSEERSKDWVGMFGLTPSIYLKNSSKEFKSVEEVITDLKRHQLLYEIYEESQYESTPSLLGYALHITQINRIMNNEEDIFNYSIDLIRLLSISQTCEVLNISRPTLYKLFKTSEIIPVEIFGKKRIQVSEIINFISKQKKR